MNRLKVLIVVLFAVALGGGVLVGMGVSRAPRTHDRGSWLAEELNLTPKQSEEMKAIWSSRGGPGGSQNGDRRRQYQKERDDAVVGLLTPEQKASYDKIVDKYNEAMAQLTLEREQSFQAAVESTKAILTEAQRAKYEELLKSGFRGGRERGDGARRGATTRYSGVDAEPAGGSPGAARPATAPAESNTILGH